jgi:hypothetical protein
VGLERGPLSLVSTTEELLERKSSGSGPENQEFCHRDPSRWPRSTLYAQKFALTSPTCSGHFVDIVCSRNRTTEFVSLFLLQDLMSTPCTDSPISELYNNDMYHMRLVSSLLLRHRVLGKYLNAHEEDTFMLFLITFHVRIHRLYGMLFKAGPHLWHITQATAHHMLRNTDMYVQELIFNQLVWGYRFIGSSIRHSDSSHEADRPCWMCDWLALIWTYY